ncbi:hypothetical protein [Thermomonas sp.]|uniref:hypothetical protein n=1 Tax=Thermomonas sp. TaxID=1971895 RepID=UPI00261E8958|nr:hypothetical protein [Thermomonas sp.]
MTFIRRTVERLRKHDWTGVIVELMVLVIGVYLGVQASNWNEDWQNERKAADFTQRLQADLSIEAWGWQFQHHYFSQVLDNARRAADALAGDLPLSDEALLVSAYRATQYSEYVHHRATYDELVSTGQIGLIRDPGLRRLAIEVYNTSMFDQLSRDTRDSTYRQAFRMLLPHAVQEALAEKCSERDLKDGDYEGIKHMLDYPCATGLPPATIAASAATLRNAPNLLALLRLRIMDLETGLSNFEDNESGIGAGLRRIAQETP